MIVERCRAAHTSTLKIMQSTSIVGETRKLCLDQCPNQLQTDIFAKSGLNYVVGISNHPRLIVIVVPKSNSIWCRIQLATLSN